MARLRLSALIAALLGCVLVAIPTSAMAAEAPGSLFDVYSVAVAPDGKRVYAGQGNGAPYVALGRDPATGLLTYLGKPSFPFYGSGGNEPRHSIVVSPDSKVVYDSVGGKDAVRAMSITDGSIEFGRAYRNFFDGISGLVSPNTVSLSPDGTCLYVAAIDGHSVTAFRREAGNELVFAGSTAFESWAAPWHIVVSPDGAQLYASVINDGAGSMRIFPRTPSSCELGPPTTVAGPGNEDRLLAIAPDGAYLYALDWSANRTVRVYSRSAVGGALTLIQSLGGGPGGQPGVQGASDIAISPDGKHVYLTSNVENSVAGFTRGLDGKLTFRSLQRDDQGGADGLEGAQSVAITPDGQTVYVGSSKESSVAGFARNATTGDLTFLEKVTEAQAPAPPAPPAPPPPPWFPPPPPGTPPPPSGPPTLCPPNIGSVGISINQAALYTNDPLVRLTITAPPGATGLRLSNDGGFAAAETRPIRPGVYYWRLRSSGPERLPRTVYVRFDGACIDAAQTYTDDVILDETPPRVEGASVAAPSAQTISASVAAPAAQTISATGTSAQTRRFVARLRARDNVSGVARSQFARVRSRPAAWRSFSRRVVVRAVKPPTWVRVRDRAGNVSRWRAVTRAGGTMAAPSSLA
jgi:DNA-binding beta-propeller fold protein YncE